VHLSKSFVRESKSLVLGSKSFVREHKSSVPGTISFIPRPFDAEMGLGNGVARVAAKILLLTEL